MEVVSRAVARLNIHWPAEKQDIRPKSKLDERFLNLTSASSASGPYVCSRFPHRGVEIVEGTGLL